MTELSPLLEHFVQTAFHVAEDQFREKKEVLPQVTLLAQDDKGVVIVPIFSTIDMFGARDGKQILPTLIQGVWVKISSERSSLKLLAIGVMADTWTEKVAVLEVAAKLVQGRYVPPSQKPDSQEAIVVQLTLPEEVQIFMWRYVRVGEEVLFSGKPENERVSAIFPGLWPV